MPFHDTVTERTKTVISNDTIRLTNKSVKIVIMNKLLEIYKLGNYLKLL